MGKILWYKSQRILDRTTGTIRGQIPLLGMTGPEYEFLCADVGMNERNPSGRNWSQNQLKNTLETNTLNLPELRALPG